MALCNAIVLIQKRKKVAKPDLFLPPHPPFPRIEMSKDALPEKACQLDSRYWRITNAKGDVEEVQGPGVVGMQPNI
jgi:hypothetical protein